jgi:hypothetical protein
MPMIDPSAMLPLAAPQTLSLRLGLQLAALVAVAAALAVRGGTEPSGWTLLAALNLLAVVAGLALPPAAAALWVAAVVAMILSGACRGRLPHGPAAALACTLPAGVAAAAAGPSVAAVAAPVAAAVAPALIAAAAAGERRSVALLVARLRGADAVRRSG